MALALQTFCMAHAKAQLIFIYLCMYYNIHGCNLGLGHMEKLSKMPRYLYLMKY